MALNVTENLKQGIKVGTINPTLVVKFDGIDKIFSNVGIKKYIRIGDPGLLIGNDWFIGGFNLVSNQSPYITYNTGETTSKISQKLDVSRGLGSSTSNLALTFIDEKNEITELITQNQMLGKFVVVYLGIEASAWPEDYNVVFQGVIENLQSSPNEITFYLNNTEEKKRSSCFNSNESELSGDFLIADSVINVEDSSIFLQPNDDLTTFVNIDDELIEYTGISGNQLTGLSRGTESSLIEDHDNETEVIQWIRLKGNGLDLALKLMLSQGPEYYSENVDVKSFLYFDTTLSIDNAIFFNEVDIEKDLGVTIGDTIEIIGANEAGNNISSIVASIGTVSGGSYAIVNNALVLEAGSPAVARFKSPYNVLPIGLGMLPKEVDVGQHLYIKDTFLQTLQLDIYVDEISNTKDFIEKEIYLPMTCYSVPRKGRSSVALHVAPLPFYEIKKLDIDSVKNPEKLKPKRGLNQNFYNQVVFKYDINPLSGKFKKRKPIDADLKGDIPIGDKPFTIASKGLKSTLGGNDIAIQSARRYLQRYQLGAEYINNIELDFRTGYEIEIADVVQVDYASLKMTDYETGNRNGKTRLMEVLNKTLDNKNGTVTLSVVNTVFGVNNRYGLISPASLVGVGSTRTKIVVKKSFGTRAFEKESQKWIDWIGETVVLRNEDFSTVWETKILGYDNLDPQSFLIEQVPGFATEDWTIECPQYPDNNDTQDQINWKFRHAFQSPQVIPVASISQSQFQVDPSDIDKFIVNDSALIHDYDFTENSGELLIAEVNTTTNIVTLDRDAGFVINTNHYVDLIGFKDGGGAYRVI